jgi:Uma2 family endonuclease
MNATSLKFGRDPLASIPTDLPSEDRENMESAWHRDQMMLLIDNLRQHWNGRRNFYCGGNMFIHYSPERARNRDFRGPDFFAVTDVDGTRDRDYWAVWEEEGRYPDVIVELLSPTTAEEDRTTKMQIYERTFHTYEYFLYDPETEQLEGYRLNDKHRYRRIVPENNRLWCETFGCWLGRWEGQYLGRPGIWFRMFDLTNRLIPLFSEAAEQRVKVEAQRADQEAILALVQARRADNEAERANAEAMRANAEAERAKAEAERANAAEAELARLKAELERLRNSAPPRSES